MNRSLEMITCPWCGTHYETFQTNCRNCGGSLPLPAAQIPEEPSAPGVSIPPPPPRRVPRHYIWRILFTDGWSITSLVFLFMGLIFGVVGGGLTIAIVTAFVGIPFVGLGILFLGGGVGLFLWRYERARQIVEVLETGETVLGEIVEVYQNFNVQVNGRHPWTVVYRYDVDGQTYGGRVTTLSRPDLSHRPGTGVYVLYDPESPRQSTTYPYPYGYYVT